MVSSLPASFLEFNYKEVFFNKLFFYQLISLTFLRMYCKYSCRSPNVTSDVIKATGSCNVTHPMSVTMCGDELELNIFFIISISFRKSVLSFPEEPSVILK